MPRRALVADGRDRAVRAPAHPLDTGDAHQPADLIPADPQPSATGGVPHLPHPVHTLVVPINGDNLIHQIGFLEFGRSDRAGPPAVVGLRGDLHAVLGQHGADRLDPETVPIGVDVAELYLSRRSSSAWAKNALAVFKISFARRNSAFSARNRRNSAVSSKEFAAFGPSGRVARSSASIQFRSVAALMSSSWPTCLRAASLDSP